MKVILATDTSEHMELSYMSSTTHTETDRLSKVFLAGLRLEPIPAPRTLMIPWRWRRKSWGTQWLQLHPYPRKGPASTPSPTKR